MAKITVPPQELIVSLVSVFKRLADALLWASQQKGDVTIELSDTYGLEYDSKPYAYKCSRLVTPVDRAVVELFLGVLAAMKEKGAQPRGASRATKRRP